MTRIDKDPWRFLLPDEPQLESRAPVFRELLVDEKAGLCLQLRHRRYKMVWYILMLLT